VVIITIIAAFLPVCYRTALGTVMCRINIPDLGSDIR
jgi:hypothetical protein